MVAHSPFRGAGTYRGQPELATLGAAPKGGDPVPLLRSPPHPLHFHPYALPYLFCEGSGCLTSLSVSQFSSLSWQKIIQQNPKHKITPTQLSAGLASRRSSEKESSRNQSWQTKRQNSPLGERARGNKTSPIQQQSSWICSAVSCNFTRSNLARRVQFCNSFKLTSAGTASVQPPHPSLHWC